jgi:hypothetical protein
MEHARIRRNYFTLEQQHCARHVEVVIFGTLRRRVAYAYYPEARVSNLHLCGTVLVARAVIGAGVLLL